MIESEWAFLALKLIDDATLFSKENVIKEYENNKDAENLNELLHEKSIYPRGETDFGCAKCTKKNALIVKVYDRLMQRCCGMLYIGDFGTLHTL